MTDIRNAWKNVIRLASKYRPNFKQGQYRFLPNHSHFTFTIILSIEVLYALCSCNTVKWNKKTI